MYTCVHTHPPTASPLLLPSPPTLSWPPQHAPWTHSISPSGAAHTMIWSKFHIYLASEFPLLWDFSLYNYYLSNWTAAFIINVIRFITFTRPFTVLSLFNLSLCPTLPPLTYSNPCDSGFLTSLLWGGASLMQKCFDFITTHVYIYIYI